MFKKRSTKNISQRKNKLKIILRSWEKEEPIGLKGANNKTSDP